MRTLCAIGILTTVVAALSVPAAAQEKPLTPAPSLAGAWTRNADLSDAPAPRGQQDAAGKARGGGGGRRRGGGGGFGGGGFGRGGGGGRGDGGAAARNPDEVARMRDA